MKSSLIAALAICASLPAFSQGKAPKPPKHPTTPPAERRQLIDPAQEGELRLVPSFRSVGVTYGSASEMAGLALAYRTLPDGAWQTAEFGLPWFDDVRNHRGSVCSLPEDTEVEIRLSQGERVLASGKTRTWSSVVPIARTIVVDPAEMPLVVSDRGTPDGWIRYVARKPLVAPRTAPAAILVTNAAYVVFDSLLLRGGDVSSVRICQSTDIRLRGCDIADWGDDGLEPRYDYKGLLCKGWNERRQKPLKACHSGGIDIWAGAARVVVERCYVHEPHARAHSWRYSHPYGPMAVRLIDSDGGHVLRWNDFVGCDAHRFDDTVGGGNDFFEKGTFRRDSDIYGNFIAFANDDCLEIDGGQQNVRVFGNRFEAGFMGVSVQGAIVSPSYVFDNSFTGCCDEFDRPSGAIKTSGIDLFDYRPFCAIFDNVMSGPGRHDPPTNNTARLAVRRNRSVGTPETGDWPRRPIPYVLDTARIDGIRLKAGVVTPTAFRVKLTCGGKDYAHRFRIRQNDATGWVKVTPDKGWIRSGETIDFEVTFDPERMAGVRQRRAAFMVATDDGFSRPVTLYAETDYEQPFACEQPGETAIYATVDPRKPFGTYTFDVPKDGRYYFMMRARTNGQTGTGRNKLGKPTADTVQAGVDGEALDCVTLQIHDWSSWMIVAPGGTYMSWIRYYDLQKGRHTLELAPGQGGGEIEGLVLTDSPGSFEPERGKFGL